MNLVFKVLSVVATAALFAGCVKPKVEPPPKVVAKPWGTYQSPPQRSGAYNDISLSALYRELGRDGEPTTLGYTEKSFNACEVRANRSANPLCKTLYLGTLHFRMTCRNNTGIVQSSRLLPLRLSAVTWRTGRDSGLFSTTKTGHGTIRFVANSTARFRPMKFYIGRKIVYKRLKDNWKIVLPRDWCPKGQKLYGSKDPS